MANFATSLVYGENPKGAFKAIKNVGGTITWRFQTGKNVWQRIKNTNRKYFQRTGRNGFCGLWEFRHIPEHSGPFSRFPNNYFYGGEKRGEQTAATVRWKVVSNWLAVFGRLKLSSRAKIPDLLGGFPRNFVPTAI